MIDLDNNSPNTIKPSLPSSGKKSPSGPTEPNPLPVSQNDLDSIQPELSVKPESKLIRALKSVSPFTYCFALVLIISLFALAYFMLQNLSLKSQLGMSSFRWPWTSATCTYNGQIYQAGESVPSIDGCNACSCDESGQVACTEMACDEKRVELQIDQTSEWKTYSAKEYNLSFDYPNEFIVSEQEAFEDYPNSKVLTGYLIYWQGDDALLPRRWMLIKKLRNESEIDSQRPLLNLKLGQVYQKEIIPGTKVPYTRIQDIITVDGTTAMAFEAPGEWEIDSPVKLVIIQRNGEYFQVFMTNSNYTNIDFDYSLIFNQILSTFAFTNAQFSFTGTLRSYEWPADDPLYHLY